MTWTRAAHSHFRESTLIISSHFFNRRFDILFCCMRHAPTVFRLRTKVYLHTYMVSWGCHSINDTCTACQFVVRHTEIVSSMYNSAPTKKFWQLFGQSSPRHEWKRYHVQFGTFRFWHTRKSIFFQTSIITNEWLDFNNIVDWGTFDEPGAGNFGAYPDATVYKADDCAEDRAQERERAEKFHLFAIRIHRLFPSQMWGTTPIRWCIKRHAKCINELI